MDIKLMALVATCVLFAACAPPNPDTQTIQPIKNQSETKSTTQLETTQPPAAQQKGTMKTIQDFENIPATQATIKTTKGDITFILFREAAPLTTANFLSLAKSGFYDGIVFHRVIPDFMAQVGDPFTKDASMQARWGQGGPGYTIADEFGEGLAHDSEGIVSMANAGPNTGGSQFFITYEATPWLDGKHAIFGKVTQGMEVLRQITVGDKIVSISYQ